MHEMLQEGREEQRQNTSQLLMDFETELTAALEERAKETDGLLERRLIEAGDGLQRRLSEFEVGAREERARLVDSESALQHRMAELETAATKDRERLPETSRSFTEALQLLRDQMEAFGKQIKELQEGEGEAKEREAQLRQEVEELREASLAQVDRRLKVLDDSVGERIRECEGGLLAVQKALEGQVMELRHHVEDDDRHSCGENESLRHLRGEVLALRERLEVTEASGASGMAMAERFQTEVEERLGKARHEWSQRLEEFGTARVDGLSEELRALAGTQQGQERALQELIAARPLCKETGAPAAELVERLGERLEALVARVIVVEKKIFAGTALLPQGAGRAEAAEGGYARFELLAERLAALEERTMAAPRQAGPGAIEASREIPADLRSEVGALGVQLQGGFRAVEEEAAQQAARLEALASQCASGESERASIAKQLEEQALRTEGAAHAAASAEEAAVAAAREARGCLRLAEAAEAVVGMGPVASGLAAAEDRLGSAGAQEPWAEALCKLECELKALMAAQVEDSAAALRSVAEMIQETSAATGYCCRPNC